MVLYAWGESVNMGEIGCPIVRRSMLAYTFTCVSFIFMGTGGGQIPLVTVDGAR
jgi:hypothetical protein